MAPKLKQLIITVREIDHRQRTVFGYVWLIRVVTQVSALRKRKARGKSHCCLWYA